MLNQLSDVNRRQSLDGHVSYVHNLSFLHLEFLSCGLWTREAEDRRNNN